MNLKDVIKKPIITEKSTQTTAFGRYAFQVDKRANKKEIAKAVEIYFKVHVKKTWTMKIKGQKKAIVQLIEGEKIDLFESGE